MGLNSLGLKLEVENSVVENLKCPPTYYIQDISTLDFSTPEFMIEKSVIEIFCNHVSPRFFLFYSLF